MQPLAPEARLRILVADGDGDRLRFISDLVRDLGHEVIPREAALDELGPLTVAEQPDVALVVVEESGAALAQIDDIVQETVCPVIAVMQGEDREFVQEAARRGISAHVTAYDPEGMQSSIDVVLRRFAEYQGLQGAFTRRAVTERAKGVLMERHGVDEHAAFLMLRDEARRTRRKLVDLAEAVLSGHPLLRSTPSDESAPAGSDEPGAGV